jgi:hypothetical protein
VAVAREHRRRDRPPRHRTAQKRLSSAGSAASGTEDAKRPYRERETLVGEHTTIINRVKGTLARLGIRSFNSKLKKAPERVEHLRTPEGQPIPPNTLAELQRDLARKQLVAEQIRHGIVNPARARQSLVVSLQEEICPSL